MDYADGGTLRTYLKANFDKLTWGDKYTFASQLARAVSCLHEEGIVHGDLHSVSILIRKGVIKLADFGLSKRIEAATNPESKLYDVMPYIDPKGFCGKNKDDDASQQFILNERSDVYSVGVLLWELSSGYPPFYVRGKPYGINLAEEISQGHREKVIFSTPEEYVQIYTECWDNEPDNRPDMNQVVDKLDQLNIIIKNFIIDFKFTLELTILELVNIT
ncbi:18919_t:CDS:2 [Funneliformis geosporum]|nr:18919_t:CDS:2 [Funneliformis geosporum]